MLAQPLAERKGSARPAQRRGDGLLPARRAPWPARLAEHESVPGCGVASRFGSFRNDTRSRRLLGFCLGQGVRTTPQPGRPGKRERPWRITSIVYSLGAESVSAMGATDRENGKR